LVNDPVDTVLPPAGGLRAGVPAWGRCAHRPAAASGRAFGHLPDGARHAIADQAGSSFGWATILQQWHEGAFDGLHVVVFSRTTDASQRLYYRAELQRRSREGPAALLDRAGAEASS
jgi:hypothetical protein